MTKKTNEKQNPLKEITMGFGHHNNQPIAILSYVQDTESGELFASVMNVDIPSKRLVKKSEIELFGLPTDKVVY